MKSSEDDACGAIRSFKHLRKNQNQVTKQHNITFTMVSDSDFEELLKIRIICMKDSLSAIGRFDPQRARERLQNSFNANETRYIVRNEKKVGFFAYSEKDDEIFIHHLYVIPEVQGYGIGRFVLDSIKEKAKETNAAISLLALKESKSNEFYIKNGFKFTHSEKWDNAYKWDPRKQNER